MPELPPSTPRSDRRSGRRHGKTFGRGLSSARGLRSRLLWTALLPAVLVLALGAAAASLVVLGDPSTTQAATVLAVTGVLCVAVLALAARRAAATARALHHEAADADRLLRQRIAELLAEIAEGQEEVHRLMAQVRGSELPQPPAPPSVSATGNPFDDFEQGLRQFLRVVESSVTQATARRQVAVFVNIARRLQSLVTRSLTQLDSLEREVEDPELLEGLFLVDHLVTRVRRQVESLAVLGGAIPRRISRPVSVYTVLRQAVAEIEHYARVKVHQPVDGILHGHAAADVIHLIAELVENAASFSPPQTQVHLRADQAAAGMAIEVEDRGLLMPADVRDRMNELLASPDHFDIGEQLKDGRIGLFVVAQLAQRHGISVRLQSNVYGGNQAVIVLPHSLLTTVQPTAATERPAVAPAPEERAPALTPAAPAERAAHAAYASRTPRPAYADTPTRAAAPPPTAVASASYGGREDPVPAWRGAAPEPAADEVHRDRAAAPDPDPGNAGRPPLPRRSGSYLSPEFYEAATSRAEQETGPNPGLMARFAEGVARAADDGSHGTDPRSS